MNRVVERPDTPAFRGMVKKVPHLLELVEDDSRVQGTVRAK
jgi:large subunit ribosomal protein L30